MRPDLRTFLYLSQAKILIRHGGRTDLIGRIDQKQALMKKEKMLSSLSQLEKHGGSSGRGFRATVIFGYK